MGLWGRFLANTGRGAREVTIWAGLTAVQMRRIGVQSLPIALFIAVFTGMGFVSMKRAFVTGSIL